MIRFIFWCLLLVIVGVPVALVAVVAVSLEDRAAVAQELTLTPEQTARGKRIFADHDPRKAPPGVLRTFALSAEDLQLALNVLLGRQGGGAKISLSSGTAVLWLSLRAPPNPFGAYLNVEAVARQTGGLPAFDRLRIGRMSVPAPLSDWLLAGALLALDSTDAGSAAADSVQSVRFDGGFVQVEYRWQEDLPERLRSAVVAPADRERLRAYQERLAQVSADPRLPREISLASVLRPLLEHAAVRSAHADASAENRAAIIALAFYVNGRGLAAIVPSARDWPRAVPHKVTLSGRVDFTQHFTISAALAATAGTALADAVGVYKELEDSRGGSGFSFTDIAADRAGTVFGQYATRSHESARTVQRRLAGGSVETDFMPRATDLPEGMPEADFKQRFGGVGAPAYRAMMQTIERRIAALALYR